MDDAAQQAIDLALAGKWKEAIEVNLKILKTSPKDVDTFNRLGRAYLETGQKTRAQETYEKVLRLDKFNSIATKNLAILKIIRVKGEKPKAAFSSNPALFLEEPGITKTIILSRLGDPKTLSQLRPGDAVKLISRGHTVAITTVSNQYVGRLSDDLASRLREFINAGSRYSAWIRCADKQDVKVFVHEDVRAGKYRTTPPFPLTEKLTYAAFTPPELIHEAKPDVSATGEQEDSENILEEEDLLNEEEPVAA